MLNKRFNVKQQGENKVLEIYLYGEIQPDYDSFFGKVESKTSAEYVQKAINEAGPVSEIKVYINSCGGYVEQGVAINNILKRQSAFVTVYIDAFAYSVASVIAMAGDKIVMPSNTTMFIHNAMWDIFGNSKDLRKSADDLDVINESTKAAYLAKAGDKLDKTLLNELMDKETFLSAEDALKYGLCDEITNPVEVTEDSQEIAEQSLKSHYCTDGAKKAIKQAIEHFAEQRKSPPAPPAKKPDDEPLDNKDFFEKLSERFKDLI